MLTFKDFVNESILVRTLIEEAKKKAGATAKKATKDAPEMKENDLSSLLDDLDKERRWVGFPKNTIKFGSAKLGTLEKFIEKDPEIKEMMDAALQADGRKDLEDALSTKYLPENVKKVLIKIYQKYNEKTGTAENKNADIAGMAFAILWGNDSYQLNKRMFSQKNIYYGYNLSDQDFYDQLLDGYIRGLEKYDANAGAAPSTFIIQNSVGNYLKNTKRKIDPALRNAASLEDSATRDDPNHADKDRSIEEVTPDLDSNPFDKIDREEREAIQADLFDTMPEEYKDLLKMSIDKKTLEEMQVELSKKGIKQSLPTIASHVKKAMAMLYDRYEEMYKEDLKSSI